MPISFPVFKFHTKLIQSILDPVAAQVSHLVIAHEEAAEGGIAHDLTVPVTAVDAAVQNLVAVGKQTLASSKDEHLIEDMPPTFETVSKASKELLEASKGLAQDNYSKPHKAMLMDGARGILQGVSGLLLVFDQSEVRKIVKSCEGIIEYLKVAEVVQTMEELVMFTQNLSPGLSSSTKLVTARTEDLTNASHASILEEETEQVKRGLPLLLSSIKAYATLKAGGKKGEYEAQENRNYIVMAMTNSLKEIIRVLQLTTPSEEAGLLASSTGTASASLPGGILPGTLAAKVYEAQMLLAQAGGDAAVNKAGLAAVEAVLRDARRLARHMPSAKKAAIEKLCAEIDELAKELAMLQANGEGESARAKEIAAIMSRKMDELQRQLQLELTRKVADDFRDPVGPLNALTEASMAPLSKANRESEYDAKAADFETHSKKMVETASSLAKSGIVTDRKLADDILSTSKKVKALAPQVVYASKMLFENPDSEAAKEHYMMLKEDYQKQVQKLTAMVDGGVDTCDFLQVSEMQLKEELEAAKILSRAGTNPQKAFAHVANAARTANRVVAVTKGESENTTDVEYKGKLDSTQTAVTTALGPMVVTAKGSITKPGDQVAYEDFSAKSDQLVTAVHDVYEVVDKQYHPPPPPPRPPSPKLEKPPAVPPRPPSPEEVAPTKAEDPIGFAAHKLDKDAKQWENNAMVDAARKMAKLMMQMSKYTRGEGGELGTKKQMIETAKLIAKESEAVMKMARKVAEACTDKRMKRGILQVVDKLPTISTQLKIIAAVKATRQGGDDPAADQDASEMLTDNAENLMSAVSEVLFATEAATIRVPPAEREKLGLQWVKKN